MRRWIALWLLAAGLITSAAQATTVAPEPTFEEMYRSAAFIGIIEIGDVPLEPADGFPADRPPTLQVKIIESWKDTPSGWTGAYLWSHEFRPDKIMSYNSFMPIGTLADRRIKCPKRGERFIIFAEVVAPGVVRDIYRWERRLIVQNLPADHPDQRTLYWSSGRCLRTGPLEEVSRTPNFYGRQRFIYRVEPDDPRTRTCLRHADVTKPGRYWIMADASALLMTVEAIAPNRDWPLHHTVKQGDTLSGIAETYYADAARVKDIAKANKILDPAKLRIGQVLLLPPVPDDRW